MAEVVSPRCRGDTAEASLLLDVVRTSTLQGPLKDASGNVRPVAAIASAAAKLRADVHLCWQAYGTGDPVRVGAAPLTVRGPSASGMTNCRATHAIWTY